MMMRTETRAGILTLAAAAFTLALAGCGGPDESAIEEDVTYEEPSSTYDQRTGDEGTYGAESDPMQGEEDLAMGESEPDAGMAEPDREPTATEPQVAQDRSDDIVAQFAALDTDSDGAIGEDEWLSEAVGNTEFSTADGDGDGTVNREEFREVANTSAGETEPAMTEFAALDTDGDGELAEDEWDSEVLDDTTFSEADRDGDQSVNRDEFRNAMGASGK